LRKQEFAKNNSHTFFWQFVQLEYFFEITFEVLCVESYRKLLQMERWLLLAGTLVDSLFMGLGHILP
jgi:hypothetical protein